MEIENRLRLMGLMFRLDVVANHNPYSSGEDVEESFDKIESLLLSLNHKELLEVDADKVFEPIRPIIANVLFHHTRLN